MATTSRPGSAERQPARTRLLLRRWWRAAGLLALMAVGTAHALDMATLDYGLRPRELAAGVWVVEGGNAEADRSNGCHVGNSGFIVTDAGVLVIGTGPSLRYGQQLRAAIARVTPAPVVQVVHLGPAVEHYLGNQAYADVPRRATAATRRSLADGNARHEEDRWLQLCGRWTTGTAMLAPDQPLVAGPWKLGGRELEVREYAGQGASDLLLVDRTSGVVFAGNLAFSDRVPTTRHARLPGWREALQRLPGDIRAALVGGPLVALVPGHGPVRADLAALDQTADYLGWLDATLTASAARGLEMNEVLRLSVPERWRAMAAFESEFARNVMELYPRYEAQALPAATRLTR